MTNQTILSLLDYLCNEARNSVHASFGLMALRAEMAAEAAWQSCLETSKSSAERLLRSIDDIRELVSPEAPPADLPEEPRGARPSTPAPPGSRGAAPRSRGRGAPPRGW